ncbi:hypothetical protein Sjap_014745 [Stephania japonica]|uniref:Uncharacterized protein n=1 Tax=Stephania japonica TaxID=461633 RepID=A0AAP0IHZ4_9MAGN
MKEALVVCSDKSLSAGVTVWDMETGDHLLHIPTCASPLHGLLCLNNHSIIASQPQSVLRNYSLEAIGPLSSTRDGLYLAGGAPSGNTFIWEVSSGRMVKKWSAHQRSISCLAFSMDGSLLVSGSDEGEICVWDLISLLDVADSGSVPSSFLSWLEHQSSITGLICTSGSSSSMLISSSLDGTCKVWDLFSGELMSIRTFTQPVNAIIIDREEQFLFSGCTDGRIFVSAVDNGLYVNAFATPEDQLMVLSEHKGPITALSFSLSGQFLTSASEDCTACLWDVKTFSVARRFNHKKGRITNIVIVPQSSLIVRGETSSRASHRPRVSLLEKYPQSVDNCKRTVAVLPSSLADNDITSDFRRWTPLSLQMKIETNVENRLHATTMAKHITDMNKQLRSQLLNLMLCRLSSSSQECTISPKGKKKKQKVSSSLPPTPPPENDEYDCLV